MSPSFMRPLALGLALALGLGPTLARAAEPGRQAAAPAAPKLDVLSLLTPPGAEAGPDGQGPSKLRMLLGFAVTSGLKYALGGLGPARFLPFLATLTPAVAVPTLIGLSLAESAASIYVFNLIAGIENSDRQVLAFLLSGASSALLTPLLTGVLGPLGATLVTNAARLLLFNLIARKAGGPAEPEALAQDRAVAGGTGAASRTAPPAELVHPGFKAGLAGDLASLKQKADLAYQAVLAEGDAVTRGTWSGYVQARAALDMALEAALAR